MKIYTFTGSNDDKYVFSFSVAADSSKQAIEALYNNELINGIEFDKLTMKGTETCL